MVIEVGDIVLHDATATKGDKQPNGNLIVTRILDGKYARVVQAVDSTGKMFTGSEDAFIFLKRGE